MKARTRFVSNSSSSSYILAVHKEKNTNQKCPTCGRRGVLFLSILRQAEDGDSTGDTCLQDTRSKEEALKFFQNRLLTSDKALKKARTLPEDYNDGWNSKKQLVQMYERALNEDAEAVKVIMIIDGDKYEFAACDISYHDTLLNEWLGECRADGSVIQIATDISFNDEPEELSDED